MKRNDKNDLFTKLLKELKISRRSFIGFLAGSSATLLLEKNVFALHLESSKPKVIQIRNEDSVFWDFTSGWHGDYVDQKIVDSMVDRAIIELTGIMNVGRAWASIIPGYIPGKKIAIKVNFNNCGKCNDQDNNIDALAEPVNAVIRGLLCAGVEINDIWVYDAVRVIPRRFLNKIKFKGIETWARYTSCGSKKALFSGKAPGSVINFTKQGVRSQIVTDVLVNADYLINMPITKAHGGAGITLAYKNHFGSIIRCFYLHDWTYIYKSNFSPNWNPLVEIMANRHIGGKTVLTIADCLFGHWWSNTSVPPRWKTFANKSPGIILMSKDPVAIDCVQRDILWKERKGKPNAEAYLKLAAQAGQGVYEATPGAQGYQKINHININLKGCGYFETYGQGKPGSGGKVPFITCCGIPSPGSNIAIKILDAKPNSTACLIVGTKKANVNTPFGTLFVDQIIFSFLIPIDSKGKGDFTVPIPSDSLFIGKEFTLQAFIFDNNAQNSIAHSSGLLLHIGKKL